jgi:hypothetical protein
MPINKKAIAEWVAALRSGRYKQGEGYLAKRERGEMKFCCLGVACDLFSDRVNLLYYDDAGYRTYYQWQSVRDTRWAEKWVACLPRPVADLLGIGTNPTIKAAGYVQTLSGLNDRGRPFETIADLIENEFLKGDTDA